MSSILTDLNLLAINLTTRCNLACQHCYMDAKSIKEGNKDELSTTQVCQILTDISTRNNKILIVLTGGEPLIRKDLEQIVSHGANLGFSIVLGTNATALTKRRIESLKKAGLMGVGISVDSLDIQYHDKFRGKTGSWQQTMNAIDYCNETNLPLQIHFSITKDNLNELEEIVKFCIIKQAMVLNIFFLVCTGRGERMSNITAQQYDETLAKIIDLQQQYPDIIIRPRCAPHFKRIAYERNPSELNKISGYDGDGCIAGISYARITDTGKLTACPYIETELGDVKNDFWDIWDNASDLKLLREPKLAGKCGRCEYQKLCGGCRARGKDLMADDDLCHYIPKDVGFIEPYRNTNITWSDEARKRLSNIPGFIQKIVKKRAEAYVLEIGENLVKAAHLEKLAQKRFGRFKPKRPFLKK